MTDTDLPEPVDVKPRGLSVVWLMPLAATVVAGYVVWHSYASQGPLITVDFPSAKGIESGKTVLRYRDMQVGLVEDLSFAPGLRSVEAHIRLKKDIAEYVDEGAEFWLVQPQVSARGVTGLDTVLSGVYIQGNWDGDIGPATDYFTARETAPLMTFGEEGARIRLRASGGNQLSAGAPVLFNGVEVGRLGAPTLSDSGAYVTIDAFIKAPHDMRLTTNTRFWDSSGVSLELGAGGVSVNVDSLAALVEGGVSFGTVVSGGDPVDAGHIYEVFNGEKEARANAFEGAAGVAFPVSVLLEDDVAGLVVGSVVRFQGMKIGEVTAISGFANPEDLGGTVQLLVDFTINPARLGLAAPQEGETIQDQIADRVASGLRARLASEGLLGQTVVLELVALDDAPEGVLRTDVTTLPLIPSSESVMADPSESLDGLVGRVSSLPIEDLMGSAIDALDAVAQLATNPELQQIPANANGLLTDARGLVGAPETQEAFAALQAASADLRSVTERLAASDGIDAVLSAMERSPELMDDIGAFTATLPSLSTNLDAISQTIAALPLEAAGEDAAAALAALDGMLNAEGADELMPGLVRTAASLETLLGTLEQSDVAAQLTETTAGAGELIAELRASNTQVQALLQDAGAFTKDLRTLELAPLAQELTSLTQRVEGLLSAPGVDDLPRALSRTLTEIEGITADLRQGGAVEALNGALRSAQNTMTSVDSATRQVAPLVGRLNALAASLEGVVADYASGSRLHGDVRAAVNEVTRAADSFRSLARTIERNPNSLITGR